MVERGHIVWDWNGTLLGDNGIVLQASNYMFAEFYRLNPLPPGAASFVPMTATEYQLMFVRPIQQFYAAVLQREVTPAEFLLLEELFHDEYRRLLVGCSLTADAHEALSRWKASGGTQSLLSLWGHGDLLQFVEKFGLTGYFGRIDGRRVPDVTTKAGPLREHLAALPLTTEVVLIGDALDDAAAAAKAGIRCVMYAGGTHDVARLAATGNPVAHTLSEAIALAAL